MESLVQENPICGVCNCLIEGYLRLKVEPNIPIHEQCLRCYQCRKSLVDDETCFIKFGRIFCHNHYRALFMKKCRICCRNFANTDFVQPFCQDDYCHAQCLHCTICKKTLTSGCKYSICELSVVCSDCQIHRKLPSFSELSNNSFQTRNSYSSDNSFENIEFDVPAKNISLSEKDRSMESDDDEVISDSGSVDSDSDDFSLSVRSNSNNFIDPLKNNKKAPRNRTVLSEKQLSTLQTYYQMNPKPDALTKEQLMEVTGLKQRVISVWFQNKRCKEKKRRISEELNKNKVPGMLSTAELMLTESPVEYDPQLPGIEIEQVYNNPNQFHKESSYAQNYFTAMLSNTKPDHSLINRCNAPLVHSVSNQNKYSNPVRLH